MTPQDKRTAVDRGERIPVTREAVMRVLPALRNLFQLVGCDTTPFSDAAIVDAVLVVCPVFRESWPTDAQVKSAFRRLQEHI
jgi:hypothetical protein